MRRVLGTAQVSGERLTAVNEFLPSAIDATGRAWFSAVSGPLQRGWLDSGDVGEPDRNIGGGASRRHGRLRSP